MTSRSDVLRAVPLFQGMTDPSIDQIAGLAHEASFSTGSVIFYEGDPGETFLVIVDGRAAVDRRGERVAEMSAGDFLGEISLIDNGPRTATVTAIEPINALVIRSDGFNRLMNDYPAVRLGILNAMAQRVRRTSEAVSD
jgi:CRP/FNR family cyclic AMP-dependent transcriptional regulator